MTLKHRLALVFVLLVVAVAASACGSAFAEKVPADQHANEKLTSIERQTDTGSEPLASEVDEPVPTITPSTKPASRWVIDRSRVPIRTDWPRNSYQDMFDDCQDHGYGGRVQNSYFFIELPPEPHTPEIARKWVAEHLCVAGRHDWAPPGTITLMQGHFTFAELDEWFNQLPLILDGIQSSSYGYQGMHNRIDIGVLDIENEYLIRERLDAAGIPQHAVHIEQRYRTGWFTGSTF